jgi:hypothetical protein
MLAPPRAPRPGSGDAHTGAGRLGLAAIVTNRLATVEWQFDR